MLPETRDRLLRLLPSPVDVAVILGSGLDGFADAFDVETAVDTAGIAGYPRSTVPGHAGRILTARTRGRRVAIFQGRVHFYEGYSFADIITPVLAAHALGARAIVVTNAAGGVNPLFRAGDLMSITDVLVPPLFHRYGLAMEREIRAALPGAADASCGRACFSRDLLDDVVLPAARDAGLAIREGVYACVMGPTYETRAEIGLLRKIGADAVGMSTVPEIIAAALLGLRVVGVSCITNIASEVRTPVTHAEVTAAASLASGRLSSLVLGIIARV